MKSATIILAYTNIKLHADKLVCKVTYCDKQKRLIRMEECALDKPFGFAEWALRTSLTELMYDHRLVTCT